MKKALVLLLCLITFISSVFAQGAKEEVDTNQPITLEFWTHEDGARQALEERYIAQFQELHPNVTVNVTRQSAEKLRELVHTAFAAGEGPSFFINKKRKGTRKITWRNKFKKLAKRTSPTD